MGKTKQAPKPSFILTIGFRVRIKPTFRIRVKIRFTVRITVRAKVVVSVKILLWYLPELA